MTAMLTKAETGAMTVAKVVDARGTACPGPLLDQFNGELRRYGPTSLLWPPVPRYERTVQ